MTVITQTLGLGLGAAPLLVELLKRNPEPVHALKATKTEHVKQMMVEFYENLQFEVTLLKMTLTKLVTELPITDELKEKLTDEKSLDPTVWKDPSPELQSALERRLNPCLDQFVQYLEKILRLLSKLVDDKSLPLPLAGNKVVSIQLSWDFLMLTSSSGSAQELRMLNWRSFSTSDSLSMRS